MLSAISIGIKSPDDPEATPATLMQHEIEDIPFPMISESSDMKQPESASQKKTVLCTAVLYGIPEY